MPVWSRGFMSWMLMILPLASMKAMLRGRIVLAIQKPLVVSPWKSKSIPWSGGMLGRNMRPSSRAGSVSATSAIMLTVWPWLLVIMRVVRVRGGAAVRVAWAPGMGVPARAVGGTQAVVVGGDGGT